MHCLAINVIVYTHTHTEHTYIHTAVGGSLCAVIWALWIQRPVIDQASRALH